MFFFFFFVEHPIALALTHHGNAGETDTVEQSSGIR
jgi:hypothetical protein